MKNLFFSLIFILFFISCEKKKERIKTISVVKIETIFEDSISVRAIEVWNDSTLWFASDQGKFGILIGKKPKIADLLLHFFISKTVDFVIVDHAGGLHVCVDDGGSDKLKSAFFEVFGDAVG